MVSYFIRDRGVADPHALPNYDCDRRVAVPQCLLKTKSFVSSAPVVLTAGSAQTVFDGSAGFPRRERRRARSGPCVRDEARQIGAGKPCGRKMKTQDGWRGGAPLDKAEKYA
jgi:hypothetical protein